MSIEQQAPDVLGGIQFDPVLEDMYQKYRQHSGHRGPGLTEIVLGDASYEKRFKMPKWNGPVSVLQEPRVALKHTQELGFSTSKNAHRQRAEYFTELYHELGLTHNQLGTLAGQTYGDHGPLVSGIVHNHFPESVKDRLRFLSSAKNLAGDAARLHEYLAKTRSPLFR